MKTHKHLSQLIASAVDHDIPTPVQRGGRSPHYNIALRLSVSSVPLGLPLINPFGPRFLLFPFSRKRGPKGLRVMAREFHLKNLIRTLYKPNLMAREFYLKNPTPPGAAHAT